MLKSLGRLIHIKLVLLKHVVHPSVFGRRTAMGYLSRCNPFSRGGPARTRGERIRDALVALGPIYVKFGQMLSTRADVLPADVVDALCALQDRVPPFASKQAMEAIRIAMKQPLDAVFHQIDEQPLASASIAQVHAATLLDGRDVVVKVLRPRIKQIIRRDLRLLYSVAFWVELCWSQAYRVRPKALVKEFDQTVHDELDLMREAANAQQLKRNFKDSDQLYVPDIVWAHTSTGVMVQERIHAVPLGDLDRLRREGVHFRCLAERGVEIFFTQVFRDAFFHADMHPGNLFVDTSDPQKPRYIGVDFGIMGTLSPTDQRYLAENMLAFFNRDYRRVAMLHVASGWVPRDTRIDQMESAIRTVSEPLFEQPLAEIAFGQVLLRLFQVAERFHMRVQPQLLLLQKTLLNVEALGRQLYPELNLWETAQPHLARFVREQKGLKRLLCEAVRDLPEQMEQALKIPGLLYRVLDHYDARAALCASDGPTASRKPKATGLKLRALLCFAAGIVLTLGVIGLLRR